MRRLFACSALSILAMACSHRPATLHFENTTAALEERLSDAQGSTELLAEIAKADAELFEAFNACDLAKTGNIFAKDLEFYHDLGGLTDYLQTMENAKANCDRNLGLRRELVEGSLEVYPMGDSGAIQIGKHTFCHLENGENDCGTFEFVHVWRRVEEGWKLARVISYGH